MSSTNVPRVGVVKKTWPRLWAELVEKHGDEKKAYSAFQVEWNRVIGESTKVRYARISSREREAAKRRSSSSPPQKITFMLAPEEVAEEPSAFSRVWEAIGQNQGQLLVVLTALMVISLVLYLDVFLTGVIAIVAMVVLMIWRLYRGGESGASRPRKSAVGSLVKRLAVGLGNVVFWSVIGLGVGLSAFVIFDKYGADVASWVQPSAAVETSPAVAVVPTLIVTPTMMTEGVEEIPSLSLENQDKAKVFALDAYRYCVTQPLSRLKESESMEGVMAAGYVTQLFSTASNAAVGLPERITNIATLTQGTDQGQRYSNYGEVVQIECSFITDDLANAFNAKNFEALPGIISEIQAADAATRGAASEIGISLPDLPVLDGSKFGNTYQALVEAVYTPTPRPTSTPRPVQEVVERPPSQPAPAVAAPPSRQVVVVIGLSKGV